MAATAYVYLYLEDSGSTALGWPDVHPRPKRARLAFRLRLRLIEWADLAGDQWAVFDQANSPAHLIDKPREGSSR